MFPALCGDPVLGFLMTNWVKNKVQLNNWSMPFRKPSFSKKLKTWKFFKIKWNLTILQLRFCILMAKFGIPIKFWSRNMYDDVCMMTFQKCHFLSRIVTKISNCVIIPFEITFENFKKLPLKINRNQPLLLILLIKTHKI